MSAVNDRMRQRIEEWTTDAMLHGGRDEATHGPDIDRHWEELTELSQVYGKLTTPAEKAEFPERVPLFDLCFRNLNRFLKRTQQLERERDRFVELATLQLHHSEAESQLFAENAMGRLNIILEAVQGLCHIDHDMREERHGLQDQQQQSAWQTYVNEVTVYRDQRPVVACRSAVQATLASPSRI